MKKSHRITLCDNDFALREKGVGSRLSTAAACSRSAALAPIALLTSGSSRPALTTPTGLPAGPAIDELTVSVLAHGAVGDGRADDTAAIRSAVQEVLAGRRDDGQVTRTLVLPAGIYRVTEPDALLASPHTDAADQLRGLTIRGVGKRSTEIFFDVKADASDDPFANNLMTAANRLRGLRISGLSSARRTRT